MFIPHSSTMNSLRFFHFIHILMFAMSIVQGSEKHMICKQVEDVFASSPELGPATIRNRIQGIPGKRGIPGIRGIQGIQGPEGPPGVVDYDRVNSTVKDYIRSVVKGLCDLENTTNVSLNEMIHDLSGTLVSLLKTIQIQRSNDIEDKCEKMTNAFNEALASLSEKVLENRGLCEFKFNDKCYWAVCHAEQDMDYTQSRQTCEFNGGKLATIFSETDYNAIMEYLRTKICFTTIYADFWLSMKIDPSTKVVTLPDRSHPSYSARQWHPSYPSSNAAYARMLVQVSIDPSSRSQGMYNYRPDYKAYGVLCEI